MIAADRNAGRVNLRVARVRERCALLVCAPDRRRVAILGVRAQVEHVAVSTRREHDRIGNVRCDLAGVQIACDDAARMSIHDDDVEHLFVRVHAHRTQTDLTLERLIRAEQQLLTGLTTRVERARYLRATEGTIGEQAAVLTCKRNALRHALIDDVHRHLSEAIDICLTRAKIAALDGVVEQTTHTVAVVLIVLCRVDTALRCDRVRATRRIVIHKRRNLVTQLGHRRRCRRASETGAHDDHVMPTLVGRVHQFHRKLVLIPLRFEGAARNLGVQVEHISEPPRWTTVQPVPVGRSVRLRSVSPRVAELP